MPALPGFTIDAPPSLVLQELHFGAEGTELNLVVQSRTVPDGVTAEAMATGIVGQLQQHAQVANARQMPMAFADGGSGAVVSCQVQSGEVTMRQYVVVRVAGGRVCMATLTAPVDAGQETAMAMMQCLASLTPEEGSTP